MTLVLPFNYTMPCGFNGDSVDFESAVVESDFCGGGGDWALPSPTTKSSVVEEVSSSTVVDLHFDERTEVEQGGEVAVEIEQHDCCERRKTMDLHEPMSESDELNTRLLVKCDERMGMEEDHKMVVESSESEIAKGKPETCGSVRSEESEDGGSEEDDDDENDEDADEEEEEEEEELFFQPPRRISMLWNSKFRWREERKKVFKISINKLRKIEDPELFLRRSVLINNTVKRLHREIREEKMARYPDLIPRSHTTHAPVSSSYNLVGCNSGSNGSIPEAYPKKRPSSPFDYREDSLSNNNGHQNQTVTYGNDSLATKDQNGSGNCNKGQRDEASSNVDPVPAKRMRTCSYNNFGGNVVANNEMSRSLLSCNEVQNGNDDDLDGFTEPATGGATIALITSVSDRIKDKCDQSRATTDYKEDKVSPENFRFGSSATSKDRRDIVSEIEKQYSQYSCGQLSIFGELQSVVFHSLIASLES